MWVIAVLAGLLFLLLLVLCVPLDMVINADIYGKPKIRLRLSWLFGLVSREITGGKEKPAEKKIADEVNKRHKRRDIATIFQILRTRGLFGRLKQLLKELFSCFKFRDLVADFRVGLGDPADTGLLFAIIAPATTFFGSSHLHRIRIEPYFGDDVVLQGHTCGTLRMHPIQLFPPFLKFVFSLTSIRIARKLIVHKWKRKK